VVRLFVNKYPQYHIFNLDKLTYAGNLENLRDIEDKPNYSFIKADIQDSDSIMKLFVLHQFDAVIHLAAESHVDRSISNPLEFVMTNVVGTVNLLNAARFIWKGNFDEKRFYHISTDEVYGSLGSVGLFTEKLLMIHIVLIRPVKPVVIILLGLTTTLMVCQRLFRIVRIIMALISFLKNSFLCVSTIFVSI
jgi:dTDP-D-glucose 4,6-dehydratase